MNPSCFSSRILDIGMLSSSLKHHIILVKVRLAFELHSCPLFRHCGLRAQRTGSSVFATGCSATSPGPRWRFFYPAGPKPPTPTGGFFYSGPFFVSPGAPQLVRRLAEWQRWDPPDRPVRLYCPSFQKSSCCDYLLFSNSNCLSTHAPPATSISLLLDKNDTVTARSRPLQHDLPSHGKCPRLPPRDVD